MAESGASATTAAADDDNGDDRTGSDPLLAWGLASFHAAALLVVPLWLAHVVAPVAVGDLLGGLDTRVGLGLYLLLWGTTWYSNRRYLAASAFETPTRTLKAGATWGAVTGLPLLVGVVLAVLSATNPTFAALLLVAGALVAPLVGAVVGVVFAGVDVVLVRLAGRLASESAPTGSR
jgi:uncharacterized integral membrane protein